MTDDKKSPDPTAEFDWDKALSEWETKSFVPEVAKDVVTDKPAALSGPPPRPLYRPPPLPTARRSAPPRPQQATPAPPPPPPRPAPPTPPPTTPSFASFPDDDDEGATLITKIPSELLRKEEVSRAPSRGGLGQLFARDPSPDAGVPPSADSEAAVDMLLRESQAPPPDAPATDVVTSAKVVATGSVLPPEPLRRPPSAAEAEPPVAEGAFFDPFADPRPQLLTIPADEELVQAAMSSPEARRDSARPPVPRSSRPVPADAGDLDADEDTVAGPVPAVESEVSRRERPPSAAPRGPARHARDWPDERPASDHLDAPLRDALQARAEWFEDEARTLPDKIARARGLLTCSELWATLGDRERAQALAAEARDLAPSLALAHRQARALMPWPPDRTAYVEALDAEIKMTPAGPARIHSTLLAADELRRAGEDDAAAKRLDQAVRAAPGEVRATMARAVRALCRGELASPALRLGDAPELAPVGAALGVSLRLRGVERKDSAVTQMTTNEALLRSRQALEKRDVGSAASLAAELALVPEIEAGATWLAAAFATASRTRRADAVRWLAELGERGDPAARRALIARAVELDDRALVTTQLAGDGPLSAPERVALSALSGAQVSPDDASLDAAASTPAMLPLAFAATALARPGPDAEPRLRQARLQRTAGAPESRAGIRLGRLLAAGSPAPDIEMALAEATTTDPRDAGRQRALSLEMAWRGARWHELSKAIEAWGARRESTQERAAGALAAALVAERAGDRERALEAFRAARKADPTCEAALRAVASLDQVDLVAEVNALADDLGDGVRAAITRFEAVARGEGLLPEPTKADLLERAHRAAPGLPIAAFLAERIARRAGDVDEVLRWIRERRTSATDPVEGALDAVREALLVADREPALAADRLREAHLARPGDVALRELYERMTVQPPGERALWREQRAASASSEARTFLFLEAAHEYERGGDDDGLLRCSEMAAATDAPLGRVVRERAELRTSRVARLADELLTTAKGAETPELRCEAYERLAMLDATARNDPGSALLWHRTILEDLPRHKPSLRYLEQHLLGDGRDDELEPIASGIAACLRGTGPGECTSHAELAARLRMRGATGSWDATRDMVELAASEEEPSNWALRMLQAHSRARGDDAAFLDSTRRLIDRASRPPEVATLLVRAGESAFRLNRLDEARALLERATMEDPGDVVAWGLLADVRQRAGDARGAGEACESLARSSLVREHQLLAWHDASRIWLEEAKDEERAIVALEAAAAIDVAHADVFDRLSHIYATRRMQPELADLLERRIERVTDPDERHAMEVRRGRALLEAGDAEGARSAFEAALSARPDDPGALSAFTELCVAQRDWDAAEQALIRLARVVTEPTEQQDVYARLGDLYSAHLLNLARAEVAYKEVLKRAPDDADTAQKLVDVYKRQNDPARALELQQELVARSRSPEEKRLRIVELAGLYEHTSHDNRRAEQTLEAARREFPQDVGLLRALAEFYARHKQTPAVNILLDRTAADARRALAAGRLAPTSFEILKTVFDLRGRPGGARATQAMFDALEGRSTQIGGAGERAFDPSLDDLLAPEVLSAPLRSLLAKTGEALDSAAPMDLRALKATPMATDTPLARATARAAAAIGLYGLEIHTSPKLGRVCLPVGSTPPSVVFGDAIVGDERLATFLALRAIKLVRVKASTLGRSTPGDFALLVSAWLKCFNPSWQPQGINAAALATAVTKVRAALPHDLDPDVGALALEIASNMGTRQATVAPGGVAWANRAALLALGDPAAALDAIAVAGGASAGAPRDPKDRAAWIARTPEARDLVAFGVTDAFADARARLGLD
ncbi:MAG TPA: tetratricopeptide repeat protein [Polyangiaceae bacterium]|nr:tetratricopeptide repeat protein [Polyangiaceae bacterium]